MSIMSRAILYFTDRYSFFQMVGRWYQYAYTFDPYNGTVKCISYEVTTPKDDRPRMFATAISKS